MNHITLPERKKIQKMLEEKISYREIAKVLGRGHCSISDEVRLKGFHKKNYDAYKAHDISKERQTNKKKRTKIEISPGLKEFIINRLKEDWSPEQIAGQLKDIAKKTVISHESIYQFIYSKEGKKLKLFQHLRKKKKPKRQPKQQRKKRDIIKYRTPINLRPEIINTREEFGHWEVDLVIFSTSPQVLLVCVERLSRYCVLFVLENKTADVTKQALDALIGDMGQVNVKSITFDNGTENAKHYLLKEEWVTLETYFCDPYCSWQKGAVENLNSFIRQYLPRKVHPNFLTQGRIDEIQNKLNYRPRKCINFKTPHYQFRHLSL